MNIKKGDKVRVISGADKGKEGIVQRVYPKINKVVVEGVNVRKKHKKEFFVGLCVNDTFLQSGYNPLKPPPPLKNKTK